MRRFFAPPEFITPGPAPLTGDLYRHIATVLRLGVGESFILADGRGLEAIATIIETAKGNATVNIATPDCVNSDDSSLPITLFQGLPKGDRMELILQKTTELGATSIFGFNAERSVARLDHDKAVKKVERWEKIVLEASRQSGRNGIPAVGFYQNSNDLLSKDTAELKLLLWEGEKEQTLRTIVEKTGKPGSISIIVGPEGGLSPREAGQAMDAGYLPVTLGKRILRTETAGLAAIVILQYLWGDLGQ